MMRLFLGHPTGGSHERFLWEGQAAIHQHIGVKKRLGIRGIVFNRCLSLNVPSIAKEASHRGGDQLKPHVVEHRWEGDALRNRADVYAVEAPTVMSTPRSSGCAKLCAKGRLGKNCRPSWHRTTSNEPSAAPDGRRPASPCQPTALARLPRACGLGWKITRAVTTSGSAMRTQPLRE